MGDKPEAYPTEHGFDEMKEFAAYYAGVYSYNDTDKWFHPWFPSFNAEYNQMYDSVVNLGEWEGVAGQPAKKVATITYDYMATMDERMADYAVAYIKEHAKSGKPFFMDVNWIKMHNPTNAAPDFRGRSHLGDYSDSLMELDAEKRPTRSLSCRRTTAPGWMPIPMPGPFRSAVRKAPHLKVVGAFQALCGGQITFRQAFSTAR